MYEDKERKNLIGQYCGSLQPFSLKSGTSYLVLEFKTDSTIGGKGFSVDFATSETPGLFEIFMIRWSLSKVDITSVRPKELSAL